MILVLGISEVIFHPKESHFPSVPKSLYPQKLTLEQVEDDCGTSEKNVKHDPKSWDLLCQQLTDSLQVLLVSIVKGVKVFAVNIQHGNDALAFTFGKYGHDNL